MKHITRITAVAGAIALAAGCAVAAPSAASAASQPVIGFSPISYGIDAMGGIWQGVQGYGASQGLSAITADPNFNPSLANQQITGWLKNKQVNGWWAITTDGTQLSSALALSSEMHIPGVVNVSPELTGRSTPLPGIAYSELPYVQLGTIVGGALGKCMTARKQTSAVYISGAPGSAGEKVELAAAKAALAKVNKNFKIIATVTGNLQIATAQTAVASSLQAHPGVYSFLGLDDQAALGAVQALKAAGKKTNQFCTTDVGGGDPALAAFKAGTIYGIGKIDFAGDLTQNINWLVKAMKDPANTPGTVMYTPTLSYVQK